MKTIILLAATPPPYMGPSIATKTLLESEFSKEFNVILIDMADRRPLDTLNRIDFVNIYLALKHYFLLLWKLIFSKAELVYLLINQVPLGFLRDMPFILFSKLFRKKVVCHLRGGNFRNFYNSSGLIMKFIIEKTLQHVDRMIVLGDCLKPLFHGLIPEEKISVVPNGLNLDFGRIKLQGQDSKKGEKIKVLFLANLIKTKGFEEVLYSVKEVVRSAKNIKFLFAGSWMGQNDRNKYKNFIKKENISDYVEFLGTVTGNKKMHLLQDADIFVFPTYYPMEGHPWVIVEAMAAGLPIITADQGCIKESVIDGKNGFIIPKRDAKAVAAKINYLIKHPDVRVEMGKKSRKYYEAKFTEEHFVQGMIDVINMTLKN